MGAVGIDLAERVRNRISAWKNDGLSAAAVPAPLHDDPVAKAAAAVYPEYQRYLTARNAVDLDDLILLPTELLGNDASALSKWRARTSFLLVDEYQDTNGAQYNLVRILAGDGKGLTVVGDDDQSIYAWRGARPENLNRLSLDFPALRVVKLEQNYRSAGRILKVANRLIANNPRPFEKRLWSDLGHGEQINMMMCRDESEEASRVVSDIMRKRFLSRRDLNEFAVLYRSNHQARVLEQQLREMNVPYRLSGGMSFFDRSEIRDIMAYLRIVANLDDDNAFLRIANTPRRGLGVGTLEALVNGAAEVRSSLIDAIDDAMVLEALPSRGRDAVVRFRDWLVEQSDAIADLEPGEAARRIVADSGYDQWLEQTSDSPEDAERRRGNVSELLDWIRRAGRRDSDRDLKDTLADILLAGMLDRENDDDEDGDQVSLMTLHAAKDLSSIMFTSSVSKRTFFHTKTAWMKSN